jgi:glutathione-regulated potassium-efflux system ancillary protein KefG
MKRNIKINRRSFLGVVGTGTAALGINALQAAGRRTDAGMPEATPADNNRVVILLAHPNYGQSVANRALIEAVRGFERVTVIDIYSAPFTVDTYRQPIMEAGAVVFQFPFHWLSAPSQLKRWCDEIFGGVLQDVKGKKLLVATTTGSEYGAYRSGGRNLFTIDELLRPYQALANHAGMIWQTPYAVYGATLPDAAESIKAGARGYAEVITALL